MVCGKPRIIVPFLRLDLKKFFLHPYSVPVSVYKIVPPAAHAHTMVRGKPEIVVRKQLLDTIFQFLKGINIARPTISV